MSKKKTPKICNTCDNCVYICEGDFICDEHQVLVMEDFTPTDEFCCCNGCDWVEQ